MPVEIVTPRLILREFVPSDAPRLHEICNQEHILRWMPDWETTLLGCETWIGWTRIHYKKKGGEPRIILAVTTKDTGELAGLVGLAPNDSRDSELKMRFFMEKEQQGKGLCTEAAGAFCKWSLEMPGVPWLAAEAEPANHAAVGVLERCGFEKQGFRQMALKDGKERLFYYYRVYPI